MATYLVTGGAGFIGSSLARALVARGDTVRVIDNFSTGKRANLADFAAKIDLIEGDIRDERLLARAMEGVEVVFHEAAIASVPQSMAEPLENYDVNAIGTLRVLEAARRAARAPRGLRRVVGRVRRRSGAAQGRDHGAGADLAVRRQQAGRGGRVAGLRARLRPGDRLPALLQRVRAAAGSALGIRRRDPEVHHRGAGRPAAAHLRRRHAVARLLPHRQRHRGEPGGGVGACRGRVGRRVQHRLRARDRSQPGGRADRRHRRRRHRSAGSRPNTSPSAPATSSTRGPTSAQRANSSATAAAVSFAEGLRRTIDWYKSQG